MHYILNTEGPTKADLPKPLGLPLHTQYWAWARLWLGTSKINTARYNNARILLTIYISHWDYLCSDRSNLNLIRWWILVIVSFVGINNDKITIWLAKIIKVTWEIILMKMKISARWRHCSKILKTNLKTHISPLLNRPQGCQGCQKNRKDLRYLT